MALVLRSCDLFAWLISHQPTVLFSQNKPATSNQPVVLFSQNKSAPATSNQPNEQAANQSCDGFDFSVKSKSYTLLIKQLIHQRLMCIVESVILPLHSFGPL
jgi:hypothetical protein